MTTKREQAARMIFEGRLTEEEIARELQIPAGSLERWMKGATFQGELERLCGAAAQEARLIVARCAPVAAMRLAELMESGKGDTARRAALDLIDRCLGKGAGADKGKKEDKEEEEGELDEAAAERILAALAGEE